MASIPPITSSSTSTLHETAARACGRAQDKLNDDDDDDDDDDDGRAHTNTHPKLTTYV